MEKRGSGVAVFNNGRVLGGDSAFTWSGKYQESGDSVKADVHVKKYNLNVESMFPATEYDMHIEGKGQGDKISGIGTSLALPEVKLNVTLTKRAEL